MASLLVPVRKSHTEITYMYQLVLVYHYMKGHFIDSSNTCKQLHVYTDQYIKKTMNNNYQVNLPFNTAYSCHLSDCTRYPYD